MQNHIETILKEQKIFIGKTAGDSMEPMLREGRDTVIITPPLFPLKKGDVPVYRRDGHYTMHRIVRKTRDGYIICGDNRALPERDIRDSDIIGMLAAFYHDGKYVDCNDEAYQKYVKRVCRKYPLRLFCRYFSGACRRIKNIFKKEPSHETEI